MTSVLDTDKQFDVILRSDPELTARRTSVTLYLGNEMILGGTRYIVESIELVTLEYSTGDPELRVERSASAYAIPCRQDGFPYQNREFKWISLYPKLAARIHDWWELRDDHE